jgi:hypothetical protein
MKDIVPTKRLTLVLAIEYPKKQAERSSKRAAINLFSWYAKNAMCCA